MEQEAEDQQRKKKKPKKANGFEETESKEEKPKKADKEDDNEDDNEEDEDINKKKKIKKEKMTELDNVLNEQVADEDIKAALRNFIKMRKTIKKPLTTHALELIIKDLNKFSDTKDEQIYILDKSIKHSWQGIFPLNAEDKKMLEQPKQYKESKMTEEEYREKGGGPRYG